MEQSTVGIWILLLFILHQRIERNGRMQNDSRTETTALYCKINYCHSQARIQMIKLSKE